MPEIGIEARTAREAWRRYQEDAAFKGAMMGANATALRNLLKLSREAQLVEEIRITLEYQKGRGILQDATVKALSDAIDWGVKEADKGCLLEGDAKETRRVSSVTAMLSHIVRLHRAIDSANKNVQGGRR